MLIKLCIRVAFRRLMPRAHRATTCAECDQLTRSSVPAMESCCDCDLGLLNFYHHYYENPLYLFDLCIRHKLVLDKKYREECGKPATLDFNKKFWCCQKWGLWQKKQQVKCPWSQNVFKNTFFDNIHSDLETLLTFINAYVHECFSSIFMRSELQLSDPSICHWASFCLEVPLSFTEGVLRSKEKLVAQENLSR